MNINDLARELDAEPYGFATYCGVPQNTEIEDGVAEIYRSMWKRDSEALNAYTEALPAIDAMQDEDTVQVEYTPDGQEIVHEDLEMESSKPAILEDNERSPYDYI